MLAPWIWLSVTLYFLAGIKLFRPHKSSLPSLLMAWSTAILLISSIIFIDSLFFSPTNFSWEPMVLSLTTFLFCIPLYGRYLQTASRQSSHNKNARKTRAS